ncbi:MAG: LptA/OstA family protein [Emcibacteraceae bacterium]|nr:LptA/OstA family protein [Emcibacteraceae bacterium]
MNTIIKLITLVMISVVITPMTHAQVSALKEHNVDNPVDISADRLEVKQKENIAFFTGNVVVTQSDMSLVSDRITVFYEGEREEGNTSSISRLDASGNVVMTSQTETIRSTWGVYDLAEKIITLGGQVVFNNAEGQITSPRLQVNLETGQITMDGGLADDDNTGRVTGQFTPPES